eukprot:CAMPEP_0168562364 /NCGR_PEP_ID=MMETSP0413-20121227/12082_1 /TAXON_ID=136452 /ORGANISM="Filamoeba nolandi, Strain NC-AS-23-1" /LENGTH=169 /DNA_ID=CAMNT_0008593783 /DNA_START=131 /DNA_END=640 /DNA_ORIENTATION=-
MSNVLEYFQRVYDASKFKSMARVTPSNQFHNGKCLCSMDFEDWATEKEHIISSIKDNPKLQRPYSSVVLSQIQNLKRNPQAYENTYIVSLDGDHCLLQLKNQKRLRELEKMDQDLEKANVKQPHWWECGKLSKEDRNRLFASGEAPKELCWDYRVVDQITNNIVQVAKS